MSIEVTNLTKMYASQKVLDSISFCTKSNHIIGVLGPNGAGKTTTMKILVGILTANEGLVKVDNIDIRQQRILAKKHIGYLAENNPLYADMYIRELLTFEAQVHQLKAISSRVDEVIARTGLIEEQFKKINQLSRGFKQRVGLAMAIIHDPTILILDEPTSGLDPNQIIEIRNLIKTLSLNKTVLLSTHIMQEVDAICDEVIVLHKGQIKAHFLKDEQTSKFPNLSMEEIFVQLTTT